MAQQVKFHSVTAEKYGEIASPDAGSLYFITDNGEIRKGSQHITGTRVYTAVDPTNGATPLNELTILLNDNVPGANDQPKKGDILIVDQTLRAGVAAQGTEGEEGYVPAVPAVVAKAAYAHNGEDWEACDGNVDASKVILTQDITMAGNYTSIGNFNKGNAATNKANFLEGGSTTSGVSVYELIKQMLQQTVNPTVSSTPSTGTSASYSKSGAQEYGTPVTATYTFSLVDGSFTTGKGTTLAAGCSVDNSEGHGYHVTGGSGENAATSNTGTYEFTAGVTGSKTVSATVDYTASTNVPTDNFDHQVSSVSIPAGTTASKGVTLSVSSYRNVFYKAIPFANKLSDADIKALTSSDIRGQGSGWTMNKNKPTSWSYTNAAQFIVLVPANDSKPTITEAKTANNLPFTFTKLKAANGTDDYTVSINGYNDTAGTGTNYIVWVDNEGSNSSDTINITWG